MALVTASDTAVLTSATSATVGFSGRMNAEIAARYRAGAASVDDLLAAERDER